MDVKPLRTEIVGASASKFELFPHILSTRAFYVINIKFSIYHGEIFREIIRMYYPDSEMEHVLFTAPFLWEDRKTLDFPAKKVAWLLAIPISEEEFVFAEKQRTEELEDLLGQRDIDIFDPLNRS